ncbi:type I polyketide synthase [Pseudonocardia endophytica]|uniref:6-deoxyerythronolide-B synthase n=1 Tax=Pseudonocardia endophytica TaxID=401976 RepID=A0A4R1HQT9_PSEEN|nr:type I polyketide synthase [Pseudonocardia endophytica]TCK24498.1 A-type KR domain-containing polyene macrolide polyketide synthase [Pseudonocardia endophytica]
MQDPHDTQRESQDQQERIVESLRRVTADLRRARRRIGELESQGNEPVAIVGMGCRLPGGVDSPERLWELLDSGTDAVSTFPVDRGWDLDALTGEGGSTTHHGGFLDDAPGFDAGFFGISPREAAAMDPQQRHLLEVSWEALERAGIDPTSLRGDRTGVFVGSYHWGSPAVEGEVELGGHTMTGTAASVLSGRLAYTLGLEGPAVTIDTACSSSLVALHLAAHSLRSGESSLAVVGGVTIMAEPSVFVEFSAQGGLSPDGRCKAFSDDADGTGWAEGVGVLVVEKLSDAQRNGHPVLAVLRGSAVNSDGASNGLTAPHGPSQERVIGAALEQAGLAVTDVDAVEAHGTGTTLGDPIEAQAILDTYGRGRDDDRPLWLGSLKSNIGHTQAAAGVAGVIKTVLALRHGVLPRTLHVGAPSSHVDWASGSVRLLTEPVDWPDTGRPRRAGVSSFGISGTNAHAVLEQAPAESDEPERTGDASCGPAVVPWVLSGHSAAALRDQAAALVPWTDGARPRDVAHALLTTRARFDHRAVVVAPSGADPRDGLGAVAAGESSPLVARGVADVEGRTVFVFPGQGSQWAGMGARLLDESRVFADRIADCDAALGEFVDWSVTDVLRDTETAPSLDRVDVVQPASFAVMVGLAALWRAHGVEPDAVVGHSQGEIAAAVVSGALSLRDGARVVALRSRAIAGSLAGRGGMTSLAMPVDEVEAHLARYDGRVSVAAVNGPRSVVVSGEPDALDELGAALEADGVRVRRIPVNYASHSHQVEDLHDELLDVLGPITPHTSDVPLFSTLTGDWLDTSTMDASYWYENLRGRVRFAGAIEALVAGEFRAFVESSSHPVLSMAVQDVVDAAGVPGVAGGSLRRDQGGYDRFLLSAAEVFVRGVDVDLSAVVHGGSRVDLPTYAFQHERFWTAGSAAKAEAAPDAIDAEFWDAVEQADLPTLTAALGTDEDSVAAILPGLSAWRRARADRAGVDAWRYRVEWTATAQPGRPSLTGTWLLVSANGTADGSEGASDGAHDGADVAAALQAHGADVHRLVLDDACTDRTALRDRLPAEIAGVVSVLAAAEQDSPHHAGLTRGLALTVALVQALGDAGVDAPCWMLTRGAVAATPGETVAHPLQSQVAAVGWTAAVEHPQRPGGTVDLPERLDDRSGQRLAAVLSGRLDGEDQLAVRGAGVLARRIVRATGSGTSRSWTPRGTTVVTGGSGTLAPGLTRWLAAQGAEHVVLLSRRGADAPGTAELVDEMTGSGTQVSAEAVDVTDRDAVAALFARLADEGRTVGTVVHTAAVIELSDLDSTTVDGFARVVHAKVTGARILDELVDDPETDLVLYSSTAGMWGSGAHAAYAAGNAFLSALAEQRRARGLRATSVHWGKWPDADPERTESDPHGIRRTGLEYLDPDRAMTALRCVLDDDETVVGLMDIDWDVYHDVFTAGRPSHLFDEIPEVHARATASSSGGGDLAERLVPMSDAEQDRHLLTLVRTEAAAVLGHASADAFGEHRAFRDAGFDSVTAVDLRNRLGAATGLLLPSTAVFDHPDPAALAAALKERALGTGGGGAQATAAVVGAGEPIAIVGMACRYPGGATSPDALLRLALDGVDAITGFPSGRGWDADALYDPDPDRSGHTYSVQGGFLHDAAAFDPGFFGISPREALSMDPQHRMLLETSWEAFERAGIDPESLRGSTTGAFFGATYQDYAQTVANGADTAETHMVTGTAASVLSGRVSYLLGLEGPAVTIDTACSSSLVAMHLACQSLRGGESSLALAGGTAVMATPDAFVGFSRQRALAADGRCKPFSDAADGMTLAEGVGVVVLERLSDARANGHPVLAVVRGSAMNSDGASNGLTAPNGPSQQRVIRQALANAGLSASEVDVVEAHGTGTALGDPIEAQALLATYGQDRERSLLLGSVKSAIGHTQAAAGVAGVITMVSAMHAGELPGIQHLDAPSSHVDWSSGAVGLLDSTTAWPDTGRPRRAGVSSFGISGTNAHLLLEQAPVPSSPEADQDAAAGPVPWLVSARSAEALRAQARNLIGAGGSPGDVGWALATARSTFDHRAVVVGETREALERGLTALADGTSAAGLVTGTAIGDPAGPVFVFPGQGAQWWGMGRELLATSEVFRSSVDDCAAALEPHVDWSLHDVLSGDGDEALFERVDVVQPALFAMMVGLAAVWRSYGVQPAAVVGHSQGEIAAACVSGALSLDDAARVVALRSRALPRLSGLGGMVSVSAPVERVTALIEPWGDAISVAAVNGPSSVVVSGDTDALDALLPAAEEQGVRAKRVSVDYASHGRHVEAVRDELADVLAPITPQVPDVAFYSTVTGERLTDAATDAGYWYTNLRQTVRMQDATRALLDAGHRVFVEVSPHPVLAGPVGETQEDADPDGTADAVVLGTLRRDDGGPARVLTSLAEAHVHGARVDWTEAFDGAHAPVTLPTYAFQRTDFWPEPKPVTVAGEDSAFWELVQDPDAFAETLGIREGLDTVLPALSAWRSGSQARARMNALRHRVDWTRVADPSAADPGRLLVVVPTEPDDRWSDVLDALGADTVRFEAGGDDRAAWATELEKIVADHGPVDRVVSLLAGDTAPLHDGVPAGLGRTLLLVQALGDAGVTAPLWCLTRGAVAAGPDDAVDDPEQGTLWGLGRVVALEHPDRWGGLVDLPSTPDPGATGRLSGLLAGAGGEDQLAIRAQGVLARRLVHAAPAAPRPAPAWRGTVLVTGGTGGIGGRVARRAAEHGAAHLLLTSRRGEDAPGAADLRAELEALGAGVTIAACDAADRDGLAALLADVPSDRPLSAVVHSAGVADGDAPVAELTLDQMSALLRSKLTAARNLDELTADLDLDAFVVFSSGAAVWGSGGQPGYAAANAYLDALAAHRRARGLPASSVAWGTFGEVGMATDPEVHERLHRQGVPAMDPDDALSALEQMVADGDAALAITRMDWDVFAPNFTATRPSPLLSSLPEAVAALAGPVEETEAGEPGAPPLRRTLEALPTSERSRALVDAVRTEAAAVLGHDGAGAIPAGRAFRDVGFDSATAVELRNRLRAALGLALPAALVFDHPTPADLARHVGTLLFGDADAAAPADDPDAHLREAIASVPIGRLRKAGLLDMVLTLAGAEPENGSAAAPDAAQPEPSSDGGGESLDDMDADALLRLAGGTSAN